MSVWLWWTAPKQRMEQGICASMALLTPAERAQAAIARRAHQVATGVLYGERKAEDSNPNAVKRPTG